jgi:hypothetical protein
MKNRQYGPLLRLSTHNFLQIANMSFFFLRC